MTIFNNKTFITMNLIEESIKDYAKIVTQIKIKPENVDYKIAEQYLPFFRLIDELKTSIIIVTDFYKGNYFYVSERFNKMFGFNKSKAPDMNQLWFRKRFHPDDFIINVAGTEFHKFIMKQPLENRKNFKLTHDFRMRNESNQWIRLLVQDYILETDKLGNPWLIMKLCDTSPMQDVNAPATSVCRDILNNEIVFSLEGSKHITENISVREKEVLKLIADGMKSKEVANKLYISSNTVNNHRRSMISKLNVSNTTEAVKLAIKLGII
ncbi:MAG: response regulator transcription factor [Bacteroidales bacterium]|jgi:DNA-binding CsgD family transcriptional regulator|nr:response regulator transcription factor [Bacteroidales bacterium]